MKNKNLNINNLILIHINYLKNIYQIVKNSFKNNLSLISLSNTLK